MLFGIMLININFIPFLIQYFISALTILEDDEDYDNQNDVHMHIYLMKGLINIVNILIQILISMDVLYADDKKSTDICKIICYYQEYRY